MKKNRSPAKKPRRYGLPKEITAALVAGAFGLVGVLLTGYFGYVNVWVPIIATQTEEADAAGVALGEPLTSLQSTDSTVTAPTLTSGDPTDTESPSAAASDSASSREEVVRVEELLPGHPCYRKVLPDTISPVENPDEAAAQVQRARDDGSILTWAYTPAPDTVLVVIYSLTNTQKTSGEWIIVENTARVTVDYDVSLDTVNVFDGGCGGGGMDTPFTAVVLSSKASSSSSLTTRSEEFDYFSLEPGETERFEVPLVCEEPGSYSVILSFEYSFMGRTEIAKSLGKTRVVCPENLVDWSIFGTDVVMYSRYVFSGRGYIKK